MRQREQKNKEKQEGINMFPFHAFSLVLNKIHKRDELIKLFIFKEENIKFP